MGAESGRRVRRITTRLGKPRGGRPGHGHLQAAGGPSFGIAVVREHWDRMHPLQVTPRLCQALVVSIKTWRALSRSSEVQRGVVATGQMVEKACGAAMQSPAYPIIG